MRLLQGQTNREMAAGDLVTNRELKMSGMIESIDPGSKIVKVKYTFAERKADEFMVGMSTTLDTLSVLTWNMVWEDNVDQNSLRQTFPAPVIAAYGWKHAVGQHTHFGTLPVTIRMRLYDEATNAPVYYVEVKGAGSLLITAEELE